MAHYSARHLLSLPVFEDSSTNENGREDLVGVIETVTINPQFLAVDGFLVGPLGRKQNQLYLPRECVMDASDRGLHICSRFSKKPVESRRVLGISAWTIHPRVLVGFVHDFSFNLETGMIDSFIIHQLIRTWTIPASAVEKITPRALLINNDTTIKLKITPFPSDPIS